MTDCGYCNMQTGKRFMVTESYHCENCNALLSQAISTTYQGVDNGAHMFAVIGRYGCPYCGKQVKQIRLGCEPIPFESVFGWRAA